MTFPHHVRSTAGAFCSRHELGLAPVPCAMTPQRLADVLSNKSHKHTQTHAHKHTHSMRCLSDTTIIGFPSAVQSTDCLLKSSSSPLYSSLTLQHLLPARTTITLVNKPPPGISLSTKLWCQMKLLYFFNETGYNCMCHLTQQYGDRARHRAQRES